jgi:hypothetical protein
MARESDASPCWKRSKMCSSLSAGIEDVFELIGRNAAALVANLDQRFTLIQLAGRQMNLAACRGELDCV